MLIEYGRSEYRDYRLTGDLNVTTQPYRLSPLPLAQCKRGAGLMERVPHGDRKSKMVQRH